MGGILARGGSRVARGRLFRGAAPSADADLFGSLGVRRVIDLRAQVELGGEHDSAASEVELIRIPLLVNLERWSVPFDRTARNIGMRYMAMLEEGHSALLRILDLLGSAHQRPTLIHCVAGRDRTGIVTGCVLDLLGVPDEAIARDYALSSVMDDAEGRNARPENLLWLLRLIREKYGSVRGMMADMGAPAATIVALSSALLEPGTEEPIGPRG